MNGKREMIRELTNSAWSILQKYENDEKNGIITREEAQKTAISRLEYLRYGEESKDYFWITDTIPVMIMHPYRSDLNLQDLRNFQDPHGKRLFVEMVDVVRKDEHGYVDYMWQWKDDKNHIVPKLSYVRIFKPWGWIIGTGIYLEDVRKEIKKITHTLLLISILITCIISFLLFFITQQSLKSEQKRLKAEQELLMSKEKYKTLVEAATEGLLMLVNGRIIFSNVHFSKFIEQDISQIQNKHITELFDKSISQDIYNLFLTGNITEGQYELRFTKNNGGFIEVVTTSSIAFFNEQKVNILTIKDVTIDKSVLFTENELHQLISYINIGLFKTTIGVKGKFIFADEITLRILGYLNLFDLSKTYILEFISDHLDKKNIRRELIETGYIRNKVLKIRKKNNELSYVNINLIISDDFNSTQKVCIGTIEDVTFSFTDSVHKEKEISRLKTASLLLEQEAKLFKEPILCSNSSKSIKEVFDFMRNNNSEYVLIHNDNQEIIGIITMKDIQNRVISLNLHLENPAYLIMSSPVIGISEFSSMNEVIRLCEKTNINYPVIRNNENKITGIIPLKKILYYLKDSTDFYKKTINHSETIHELSEINSRFRQFIIPLIKSNIDPEFIFQNTSFISDEIIQKCIELTIDEIGNPPVHFSFICLGSEGRKEETLFTDQDNAIIFEDSNQSEIDEHKKYFLLMGESVSKKLNQVGYSFCKGNIMASNPNWCMTLQEWKNKFHKWVTNPEPQHLLDIMIFFDFRHIAGLPLIASQLRDYVSSLLENTPSFFYHIGLNTRNTRIPQNISENLDSKELTGFIVMFARAYSLKSGISEINTLNRIKALEIAQIIKHDTAKELIYIYRFLMKLRLQHQVSLLGKNQSLSNTISTENLNEIELGILKKSLSFLQTIQNNLGVDFSITT